MRLPLLLSLISLATAQISSTNPIDIAIDKLDALLAINPNDFSTLYKKAVIRLSQGSLSKAKDGFKEVLKVREFDQAYLQLAKIYSKLGEFPRGLENVESFLKMGSNAQNAEGLALVSSNSSTASRESSDDF